MNPWKRSIALALAAAAITAYPARTPMQAQITPLAIDQGATGLGLALRQLPNDGAVLMVTAHPDDENNGLLVKLNRGLGLRTALLTVTRGDGGQNEIGPELFQGIGILRGEELMLVHKYDGAEQYHTRAFEFGYSFSDEETFQKWGREQILEDVVRVVRKVRPDVIVTMPRRGTGGGQHHQAAAQLGHEAFAAAADPSRFPQQIKEGLLPWQTQKSYEAGGGGGRGRGGAAQAPTNVVMVQTGDYDQLLGMSWNQFGTSDLRAYNQRLLDFVRNGGHLVVQYNKTEANQLLVRPAGGAGDAGAGPGAGFGGRGGPQPTASPFFPYPALVSRDRITVEEAPIRVLVADARELNVPNKITSRDFDGWVQERGLYFFGANDPKYVDLLAATDPWPNNPGEKKGLLTVAPLGRGTWTYVGLGLWRQLPAGTPGAYRILANLISKPRAAATSPAADAAQQSFNRVGARGRHGH